MSLEQDDLQQIGKLIAEQLTQFRSDFLKEEVAPMVSGATKRALSEAPQITAQQFEEQISQLTKNLQASQVDPSKLVEDAVGKVLQQLADMPDDDDNSGNATTPASANLDTTEMEERLKQQLLAEFEEKKLKPLTKKLTDYEKAVAEERAAREAAEKANTIKDRNQRYIQAIAQSKLVSPEAADMVLDIALKKGYLKPSEDETDFVIEQPDRFGLDTQIVSALDQIPNILDGKSEFDYFRPARAGTGLGSTPQAGRTQNTQPSLQVLPDAPDDISAEQLLQAFSGDNASKALQDLATLEKAG